MLNLILKDILVQKRILIFGLLYGVFIFFALSQPPFSQVIYSMGATAISYIFILTALQADFKNNSIIILNSLPVKRSEIVASKYLFLFAVIALSFLILAVAGLLINVSPLPFRVKYPELSDLIITFLSVGILLSVYIPVYFKTGGRWIQIVNVLFFLFIFFAPSTVFSYFMDNKERPLAIHMMRYFSENVLPVYLAAVFLTLLILAVSFICSLKIYSHKDL